MKNICIMGFGFVGQALANICKEVPLIIDPKIEKYKNNTPYKFDIVDIVFICVNTPTKENGHIDDSNVNHCLDFLNKFEYRGVVVIKSTILYECIDRYMKVSGSKLRIVHNPEFLEQNTSFKDMETSTDILIGCNDVLDAKELMEFYTKDTTLIGLNKSELNFEICSIKESCDFKYIKNIYGAMLVTFWEMVHDTTKGNSRKMAQLLKTFPTGDMHIVGLDGYRGFGGACFPKDVKAWNGLHKDEVTEMLLNYNKKLQG